MWKFEISDAHTTADIGLSVEADSVPELFQAAAEGMFTIILGAGSVAVDTFSRTVTLQAESADQLLIDWLSELIYLFDAERIIPVAYHLTVAADGTVRLHGDLKCRHFDPDGERAEHEIKAVTYYMLRITKEGNRYRCHVVFDL